MDKLRKFVGILLILIGVSIIGVVAYKKIDTNKKQQQLLNIFEGQTTAEGVQGNLAKDQNVSLDDAEGYTPIAIMEIPRIKLKQVVVEGTSDDILQYFLGHFDDSVMPGEVGNFSVAGHRVSSYTDAFINLYKVKSGDEVIIQTKEKKFTYEVEDNFIVNPEDVEVLENADYEKITLITCTVGAKQRVIVTGRLVKSEDL